jgi:hypothetical protein
MFQGATEGETPELKVYGYRTGDSKRALEIGVGVDAADTVSFDGLSNYLFDGTVQGTTLTDGTFSVTGGAITGATNINWDAAYTHVSNDGSDHSFIDQDVTSGSAPTFTADNFSDGGTNAIITTTQETNFEAAYSHISNDGSDHSFIDQDVTTTGTPQFGRLGLGMAADATARLKIGSTNATDSILLYHDNANAYIQWNDGSLYLENNEASVNAVVAIRSTNATPGYGELRVYDQDQLEYFQCTCSSGAAYFGTKGTAPGIIYIQNDAHANIAMFQGAAEGETPELRIYGRRTGDSKRALDIGVGVDAADTASFDGVSNYRFNGVVNAVGGFSDNGSAGIDGSFLNGDGNTVTVSGGIITAITSP